MKRQSSYHGIFRLGLPWLHHNTGEEFLSHNSNAEQGTRKRNQRNEETRDKKKLKKSNEIKEGKVSNSLASRYVLLSHCNAVEKQLLSTEGMETGELGNDDFSLM